MLNISKITEELLADGLPIHGLSDPEGTVDWHEGHPIEDEQDRADAIIAAHDPTDYEAIRSDTAYQGFMDSVAFADWTAEELATWVQANVNDLASAKATLVKMAWAIGKLADRAFPQRRGQQPD